MPPITSGPPMRIAPQSMCYLRKALKAPHRIKAINITTPMAGIGLPLVQLSKAASPMCYLCRTFGEKSPSWLSFWGRPRRGKGIYLESKPEFGGLRRTEDGVLRGECQVYLGVRGVSGFIGFSKIYISQGDNANPPATPPVQIAPRPTPRGNLPDV